MSLGRDRGACGLLGRGGRLAGIRGGRCRDHDVRTFRQLGLPVHNNLAVVRKLTDHFHPVGPLDAGLDLNLVHNLGPGVEQEHLNNVFGARLRITALRAASGPGVEFLEYLAPADGRPYPAGTQANDLWHWQTRFPAASAEETCSRLRTSGARFVSSGTVTFPDNRTGFRKSCIVRDPDGHAVQIVE